jgi:hypothetical protein
MSASKRKTPDLGLQRRVRPRVEPEPESDVDVSDSDAPSEEGFNSSGSEGSQDDTASDVSEDESEAVGSSLKLYIHQKVLTLSRILKTATQPASTPPNSHSAP